MPRSPDRDPSRTRVAATSSASALPRAAQPNAIAYVTDAAGRVTQVNRAWLEYTGLSVEGSLGLAGTDVIHADDLPALLEAWGRATSSLQPYRFEYRLRRADGAYRWHLGHAEPLYGTDGTCCGWVGSATDIHDARTLKDAATLEPEGFDRRVLERVPVAIYVRQLEGRGHVYTNPTAVHALGAASETILTAGGEFVQQTMHPEDFARIQAHEARLLQLEDDQVDTVEYRMRHADGSWRWFASSETVYSRDESGRPVCVVGAATDISAHHDLEEALQRQGERLALAKDAARLGVHEYDVPNDRIQWDRRVRELWGVGPDEPINYATFMGGLHPDDRAATQRAVDRSLDPTGDGLYRAEYRVIHRIDGRERWIAATGQTVFEHGQPVWLIGTVMDVTEQKAGEQLLLSSQARLREVNEAQRRFVSDAAHELRAPLTSIQGNLELLERYPHMADDERHAAIGDAAREAARLGRLVSDLLALARGENGEGLELAPLRLDKLLSSALKVAQPLAAQHTLSARVDEAIVVAGHEDRLRQVIVILLENALKYTPAGGAVHLEAVIVDGEAQVRIADNGPGIAKEDLERVFDRFYRSDKARVRGVDPGGTGLGLAIARRIVEQHGGQVWPESALGVGTTAVVRLPRLVD